MNILIHYRHFPVAMGRYIHWALESIGHNVYSVGEFSRGHIPWGEQFYYPDHQFPPNLELPPVQTYPLMDVLKSVRESGFNPELVIQCGDVSYLSGPSDIPNIIIATDPHAVDYTPRLAHADQFVCMQKHYLKDYPGGIWMPYGYDRNIHKNLHLPKIHDVVFCGLQYSHRIDVLKEAQSRGLNVYSGLGLIYEDYVKKYNEGLIAFNWSSKDDLPARFWEGMAMGRILLTNTVPDMAEFNKLKPGRDYLTFTDKDDAIDKMMYYSKNPDAGKIISESGEKNVKGNTWEDRVEKMLKECGYA